MNEEFVWKNMIHGIMMNDWMLGYFAKTPSDAKYIVNDSEKGVLFLSESNYIIYLRNKKIDEILNDTIT